jgi:hypothetical protein
MMLFEDSSNSVAFLVLIFAIGYGVGSSTFLERWEHFTTSSWWNLYLSLVLSYITIRIYNLFIDPFIESIAPGGGANNSGAMLAHNVISLQSPAAQVVRRQSLLTAKDMYVFNNLKKIDEEGNEEEFETTLLMSPRSAISRSSTQQPIDMSGSYKLVENHNFEAFLGAQGLPWMICRAADRARPVHTITHIGKFVTIKIEGIIESSSTYEINGEPLEGLIRGRLFADSVTVRRNIARREICHHHNKKFDKSVSITHNATKFWFQFILSIFSKYST